MTAPQPIGDFYSEPVDDFDGDCDGYPQDYALLAKIEAANRAWANGGADLWKAKLTAERAAKPCCDACGATLPEHDECYDCSAILVPVERLGPNSVIV